MNRIITAILLLVFTFSFGAWSYFSIINGSREMIEVIENDCKITIESQKSSAKRVEEIQSEWKEKESLFSAILPHSELDEIEIKIKELSDFHSQCLTEEYIKALNECANRFEHIIESEKLDLKNIF